MQLIHDARAHLHQPVAMPQQLPRIAILRVRHPDSRERSSSNSCSMTETIPNLSEYFRAMGKKGGKARAQKLTAKRRKEISAKGNKARWAKAEKEGR